MEGSHVARILVTGVGGPAGMALLSSLKRNGEHYLIGVDSNQYSRGKFMCHEFHTVPLASDDGFIDALAGISKGCDGLFCTVDEELIKVSESKDKLGCKVYISEPEALKNCLDKLNTMKIFEENNLPIPKTCAYSKCYNDAHALNFPVVVKPRSGRGGRGVYNIGDPEALIAVGHIYKDSLIMQEYLTPPEYTADVLADDESNVLACVVRERVTIKGGITVVGRTVSEEKFRPLVEKAVKVLGLKFIVNMQFRSDPPRFIEVNPRSSGSLMLSIEAAVNMPQMLVDGSYHNKEHIHYKEGLWYYRDDQHLFAEG